MTLFSNACTQPAGTRSFGPGTWPTRRIRTYSPWSITLIGSMIYRYTINNAFKETEKLDVFFKLVYGEIYCVFLMVKIYYNRDTFKENLRI